MADRAPVEFDPFSREYYDDPSEVYRRLRDEAPVYRNDHYGFYALSRWDDVAAASKDWATFTSTYGITLEQLASRRPITSFDSLIMIDPPKHDRLRSLVSRVFTPRAVAAMEPMARDVIAGCFDHLADRTSFDLVEEVVGPFPVEIICRMLGVPAADRQQIRHWLDIALSRDEGSMKTSAVGMDAAIAMGTYFYELSAAKRAHPGDDMVSRLVEVEWEDEDGNRTRLDDAEIAGFSSLIGGAGAETVTKLLGNAVVLFARHPDQWQLVLEDPGRIPVAVEEILRYHPPSQYQGRFATEEHTLHGVTIPAGWPVLLLTGAATHDPRAYEDPDRFDIRREPKLALGFGYGVHSCLGAALARMESRLAIEELRARYPRYRVVEEGLTRVQMSNVAGYATVPVEVA